MPFHAANKFVDQQRLVNESHDTVTDISFEAGKKPPSDQTTLRYVQT